MDSVRKLIGIALVLVALYCVVAWFFWFRDDLAYLATLPVKAKQFPLGPQNGPAAVALGSFLVAFFVWPPDRPKNQD